MPMKAITPQPGFLIRRLQQVSVSMFHTTLEVAEITPIQHTILQILLKNEALPQRSIATLAYLDASTTGDVIKRLENRKLIFRSVSISDRRSKVVEISDAGRSLLAQVKDQIEASQKHLLQPLDATEREIFLAVITKVLTFHEQRNGK